MRFNFAKSTSSSILLLDPFEYLLISSYTSSSSSFLFLFSLWNARKRTTSRFFFSNFLRPSVTTSLKANSLTAALQIFIFVHLPVAISTSPLSAKLSEDGIAHSMDSSDSLSLPSMIGK